ncbi:MAG: tetratricopeptide repeat protein [candidate division WOR-3 bacterium]
MKIKEMFSGEKAQAIRAWVGRNRSNLLWGFAAVVVGVAFLAYTQRGRAGKPKGQWEYVQAVYLMSMGDTTRAIPALLDLYQRFPNTRWGKKALYYLGYHYFSTGDIVKAEEFWSRFLASKPGDPFTEACALSGMASIRMNQERYEEAERLLSQAAEKTPYETYKAFYTYRRAMCMEISGNPGEALGLYREIKQRYEKTPSAVEADARIRFLSAYLGGG